MNLQENWSQCLPKIKPQIDDSVVFDSFIHDLQARTYEGNSIILTTPFEFNVGIVEEYLPLMAEIYNSVHNTHYELKLLSESQFEKEYNKKELKEEEEIPEFSDNLNPDFTFDNFVVGNSNRIAQNASLAVAMKPGTAYSPLFIYSNSGLGKTHLLNAIGNFIKKKDPKKMVLYASSEQFVNDYISSLGNGTIKEFNLRYRNIDTLLIDDIQFIASKESSSEMFFNIFNSLQNDNKQIVITSDKPPKDLKGMENRLVSRFTNGLTVSIDTPEFETSKAILQKKLEIEKVDYPISEEVLDFISSHFNRDVRELEGSLKRLLFYKLVFGQSKESIDLEFALEAFEDSYKSEEAKNVQNDLTVDEIKKCVATYYNLSVSQINSKSRTSNIIVARHIAMYLVRNLINDMSFIQIGKEFGGRDHSTVMKACDKVEKNMKKDAMYKKAVQEIKKKLS